MSVSTVVANSYGSFNFYDYGERVAWDERSGESPRMSNKYIGGIKYKIEKKFFEDIEIYDHALFFFHSSFKNVTFISKALRLYSIISSNLIDVVFHNVILGSFVFEEVIFVRTKIINSIIVKARFFKNYYDQSEINYTKIENSSSRCEKFKGLAFESSSIDDCYFDDCDFNDCDLSGVDITNSVFFSCKMSEELRADLGKRGNVIVETLEELKEQFSILSDKMKKKWAPVLR